MTDYREGSCGVSAFVVGQRVRVTQYEHPTPLMGDPHCIVGHFGHVTSILGRFICVQLSHGPNAGLVDRRIVEAQERDRQNYWPMIAEELEAVD